MYNFKKGGDIMSKDVVPYFNLFAGYFFLYLMEAFQTMLFLTLVIGFIYLVMKNDKYEYLAKSIERFF